MAARISRALNLVIPVDTESQGRVYVHSTPISRETFEQFFFVMSKTFSAIFTHGLGPVAGPPVAYLMLKKFAEESGQRDEVERGLINEMIRLSNVAYMSDKQGWQTLPLSIAIDREIISEDDLSEVRGQLVFFMLVARLYKRSQVEAVMETVNGLWGSQATASPYTEFLSSLPTSTPTASTGEMVSTASVPR